MRVFKKIDDISYYTLAPELLADIERILGIEITKKNPMVRPELELGDPKLKELEDLLRQFGYKEFAGIVPYQSAPKRYGYSLRKQYDERDVDSYEWGVVRSNNIALMCEFDQDGVLVLDELYGAVEQDPSVWIADGHLCVSKKVKEGLDGSNIKDFNWGEVRISGESMPVKGFVDLYCFKPKNIFPSLNIDGNKYFDKDKKFVEWGHSEGFCVWSGEYVNEVYVYDKEVLDRVKGWDCALMYETLGFSIRFRPTFMSRKMIKLLYDLKCDFKWSPLVFK